MAEPMSAEDVRQKLSDWLDSENDMFMATAEQMAELVLPIVREAEQRTVERAAQTAENTFGPSSKIAAVIRALANEGGVITGL